MDSEDEAESALIDEQRNSKKEQEQAEDHEGVIEGHGVYSLAGCLTWLSWWVRTSMANC